MTGCTGYRYHDARVGEEMLVTGNAYGQMTLRGDRNEVACIPHRGCRLETVKVAPSINPEVKRLLPLEVITFIQVRFLRIFRRDLFLLPNGREVTLKDLEGFKFKLMPLEVSRPPREEDILRRAGVGGAKIRWESNIPVLGLS